MNMLKSVWNTFKGMMGYNNSMGHKIVYDVESGGDIYSYENEIQSTSYQENSNEETALVMPDSGQKDRNDDIALDYNVLIESSEKMGTTINPVVNNAKGEFWFAHRPNKFIHRNDN